MAVYRDGDTFINVSLQLWIALRELAQKLADRFSLDMHRGLLVNGASHGAGELNDRHFLV